LIATETFIYIYIYIYIYICFNEIYFQNVDILFLVFVLR
jgi:hypothetical protein